MEKELRRNQNTLIITGLGVIVLSLWSVIKTVLFMTLDPESFDKTFSGIMGGEYNRRYIAILLLVLLALDFLLRTYAGLKARKEGRGENAGWLYVVVSALFSSGADMTSYTFSCRES